MSPNAGTARPSHPHVSICIPVYNGADFIWECIGSALAQTDGRFELLVLDNCSTDGTAEIVTGVRDSRIRYIRNETNIGSIANFNRCIEHARGEFFVLLPHDDLLRPNCLKEFLDKLQHHERAGFAYASCATVDAAGRAMRSVINHAADQLLSGPETIRDVIDHFHPIQLAMARTAIVRSLGGFDPAFASFCDIHLWVRIAFAGWQSCYISEPLSHHRVHGHQGQQYFKQSTDKNLAALSEHYGKTLDRSFFVKNSHNQVFFDFIRFLSAEMARLGQNASGSVRTLLKQLASSNLQNLVVSVGRLNGFMVRRELFLWADIARWAGVGDTCRCYGAAAIHVTRRAVAKLIGGGNRLRRVAASAQEYRSERLP